MNNLGRNSDIIWLNISVGHDTLFSPVQGVYLQLYILCTSFRFYCQSAYFAELYCFLQHLAAAKGYEEIVRFLIQHGANTNCIGDRLDNPFKVKALVACCSFVQFPVLQIILEIHLFLRLSRLGMIGLLCFSSRMVQP